METQEVDKSVTNDPSVARRRGLSRRSVLSVAGALGAAAPFGMLGAAAPFGMLGAAAPFGMLGAARALTTAPPYISGDSLICRVAASNEPLQGPPRKLTLAWYASAICTS